MTDPNLSTAVSDWSLPLQHEKYWSAQFTQGGRTMLDVGAHVGTWCLRLAPLFERVYAFEPDPRAYRALRENIERAGLKNVEVIPKAVTNRSGSIELNLYENPSTNSMFGPADTLRHGEKIIETVKVDAVSLDDFCWKRGIRDVDFCKVDVEGAEMLVVEGAQAMFLHGGIGDFWIEMHDLFYDRLRRLLDPIECDVLDGGKHGLSLARHRPSWPGLPEPHFKVYAHPISPTNEQMRELRARHGIAWEAPTSGWLSEVGE